MNLRGPKPQPLFDTSAAQHKTLDIVTLFHKASSPSSIRVANLLKQASASASAYATEDQAAQTTTPTHANHGRDPFELNITEELPTEDQVQTILKYAGPRGLPTIIRGARDEKDALKKYKENKENFLRPVVRLLFFFCCACTPPFFPMIAVLPCLHTGAPTLRR